VAGYLGCCAAVAWFVTAPRNSPAPAAPGWDAGTVRSADGIEISLLRRRAPGRPCVVLGHGFQGNKLELLGLGETLAGRGFAVLAFDFRGHGESGRAPISFGVHEAQDLDAVLDLLDRERGGLADVAYVGLSMGAAAATLSRRAHELGALVLVGCYDRLERALVHRYRIFLGFDPWPLDLPARILAGWIGQFDLPAVAPVEALARLRGPRMLLLHGTRDRRVGAEAPRLLVQAAGPGAGLRLLEADHRELGRLTGRGSAGEQIVEFLEHAALRPASAASR
jgi:pimeloyl-ACP methyl ester carboxylesterase